MCCNAARDTLMEQDQLFERLWSGTAPMEEWTEAVSHTAITTVADNIITVHSTYFCGSVTAIRTAAGLVLIDTANAALAARTFAAIRRWDASPVHTVIYTHGHIDHTGGIKVIDGGPRARPGAPTHRGPSGCAAATGALQDDARLQQHRSRSAVQLPELHLPHRPATSRRGI